MTGLFGFGWAELLTVTIVVVGVMLYLVRVRAFRGGFRKLILQFSLRELLLAMTAGGALIALCYHEYPGRRSDFCNTFDPEQTLAQACKDQGIPLGNRGRGGVGSGGPADCETDCTLNITLPADQAEAVFWRFRDRVRAEIEATGCRITGESEGRPGRFSLRYVSGRQTGRFYAYGHVDGDELHMFVVHLEFRQR